MYILQFIAFITCLLYGLGQILLHSLGQRDLLYRHFYISKLIRTVFLLCARLHSCKAFLWRERFLQLLHNLEGLYFVTTLSFHIYFYNILNAVPYINVVDARFQNISRRMTCHTFIIIGCHGMNREAHGKMLRFTRLEIFCLAECCQSFSWLSQLALWRFIIDLNDFFTRKG
ncbi:hypothetical protein D3C78_1036590 [compost metagenome]